MPEKGCLTEICRTPDDLSDLVVLGLGLSEDGKTPLSFMEAYEHPYVFYLPQERDVTGRRSIISY